MYNLRARFYDPTNGRFNQRDAFVGDNDDPQSLHKYLYCQSDPLSRIDPGGDFSMLELLVVFAVIALISVAYFALFAHAERGLSGSLDESKLETYVKDPESASKYAEKVLSGLNKLNTLPPGCDDLIKSMNTFKGQVDKLNKLAGYIQFFTEGKNISNRAKMLTVMAAANYAETYPDRIDGIVQTALSDNDKTWATLDSWDDLNTVGLYIIQQNDDPTFKNFLKDVQNYCTDTMSIFDLYF